MHFVYPSELYCTLGGLGIVGCVYIKLRRLTIIEFLFTHWEFCMLSLKSWACLWSDWRDWLWENLFFNLNFRWFSFIQVLNLEAKVWMLKVKLFDYSAFKNGSNFHIKHIEFDILFTVLLFFNSVELRCTTNWIILHGRHHFYLLQG